MKRLFVLLFLLPSLAVCMTGREHHGYYRTPLPYVKVVSHPVHRHHHVTPPVAPPTHHHGHRREIIVIPGKVSRHGHRSVIPSTGKAIIRGGHSRANPSVHGHD